MLRNSRSSASSPPADAPTPTRDRLLRELAQKRSGRLTDIIKTIEVAQDQVMRAESDGAIVGEDAVEYADGTKATVDQMSYDVTNFLAWAASPKLEDRKGMGLKVMLFLIVLTGLLIAVKKKIWASVH